MLRPSAARSPRRPPSRPGPPTARTSHRSFRRTARNATDRARSVRSRWKPTSKRGNARPISRLSSRTARCLPGRQRRTSASSSRTPARSRNQEIATLVAWSEADAPEGNPADLPTPPKFPDDWQLGTPDLVVDIGADFAVPADGDDIYRCFVVPTHLEKDQYVSAVEYRPGNRRVVHHILAYVDTLGQGRERDQADPGPGYTLLRRSGRADPRRARRLGARQPAQPYSTKESAGRCRARAISSFRCTITLAAKPETDRTKIGLYFARKPVKQIMHWSAAVNPELDLPPGQSNIEVKAAWQVPVDLVAHCGHAAHASPGTRHAHVGEIPRRPSQDLIKIDDWDFNWQYTYYFEKPLDLPKGSRAEPGLALRQFGDKSQEPQQAAEEVKWGEATTDEMCIGFIAVTKKGQDLTKPGEKDDFQEILRKQARRSSGKKYEKAKREAAAKDSAKEAGCRSGEVEYSGHEGDHRCTECSVEALCCIT